ncbi:WD40 repeat domain-containing protein [Actinomadura sp. ATCC 31491]|uniref:WD40 repeat domain-containing protein n=1 Tax=Actinomadura luzonensis TaxID=2805427 RepID=A0ABT0GCW5_9ACTN|nr:WD40 repeat domain-containing protein [Actinomadura luzonensis]MCK2221968.1 WD40 repeat domain-containing protein [Actinomadura luzonensis]
MIERGDRPSEECPYQGLAPFEAGRAELFFGRGRATANLLGRLGRRLAGRGSVLLVTGASGVGKSSLLRAGLIPAVAEEGLPAAGNARWHCVLTTPTARPLRALPEPPPPGGRLLLVVDQFEELFTLVSDERERQAFVAALHALTEGPAGAGVVVGVRADYWERCAAYPQLAEAIQDGQVIVEPMAEPDLRLAITGPAATAGLSLEPGLVETILDELRAGERHQAGALPLLSQALRNTWERRKEGTLTVRGYEESGRVRDSVRRTADEVLARLPPEDRRAALRIFRRLTLITAGGRLARRAARLPEVHAAASARTAQRQERVGALLSAFADRRLLTLHEDTVEIAHDALLTAWPALRQWLEPDLAAQSVYDRLIEAAAQWEDNHRDPAFLYRGARLLAVQDSRVRWERDPDSYPPPGPVVEGFVAASVRAARRAGRRRRLVVTGLALLSALALAGAAAAVNAAGEADRQRRVATSRQLAAQSEVTGDVALSSLLAVAAWRMAGTDEARNRLLSAAARTGRDTLAGHEKEVVSLAFSADGSAIATGSQDGTARLWDTASRRQLGAPVTRPRFDCSAVHVALSPDGRTLATACLGGVRFYDVAGRRELGPPIEHEEVVSALAYRPDGRTLVTGDFRGVVRQWDAVTHRPHGPPMGRPDHGPALAGIVRGLAFSRDGASLAVARGDTVRLWDPATARPRGGPLARHAQPVLDVAFSPDGRTLATVSWDDTARLWSLPSGRQSAVLRDRTAGFTTIAFSPDGTRIATGGPSGRTVLWDAATRQPILALADNVSGVERVAFSPDGGLLAAAGDDGLVRLADPKVHLQIGRPLPGEGAVALSPDGRILATGVPGRQSPDVRLWDVATQRPLGPALRPAGARRPVTGLAFLPGGRTLVTSHPDGLRLWDVASRRPLAHEPTLKGLAEPSPDGRYVAVQHDRSIAFWDVAGRRESGPRISVPGHTDVITGMAISPDGRTLASAGFDARVRLFDVASRRPIGIALIAGDAAPAALAFSPDGEILATGSTRGEVLLWDLRTHRPLGAPMTGHGSGVAGLAYSRDGRSVASVAGDGTARLWNVALPADLLGAACANAGRSLTREEWQNLMLQEEFRPTCP